MRVKDPVLLWSHREVRKDLPECVDKKNTAETLQ
jgi:hypothetical protein